MDSARPRVLARGGAFPCPDYPALEVALFAFICFLPSLRAGFVYDDLLLIQDNRYVHDLAYVGRAFMRSFWQLDGHGNNALTYYRPLVTVSYIIDWVIFAGKPWSFHLFNIVAHAATTYLVVRVARRWTGHDVLAVGVALLFALHPSRTESVVWIAGRTDVLMAFFVLLSVELSHRGASAADARARRVLVGASLVSLILGLLSKETAAILPLFLVTDVLVSRSADEKRALVAGLTAHVGVVAAYIALRLSSFPVAPLREGFTLTPRYGLLTVWQYVERVLWPWPQTFFYRPLRVVGGHFQYETLLVVLGAAIAVLYVALVARMQRRDSASALLLVTAAASLGPLLNFTNTGIYVTTSDHFLYLPLFLFLAGIARFCGEPLVRFSRARGFRFAFFVVLFTYAAVATARTRDYEDQESLFLHEFAVDPDNPIALKSLSEVRAKKGELDAAFELLLRATRPASLQYALLVPAWRNHQHYIRLLDLQAARTADGDVTELSALYGELDALLRGAPPPFVGKVGELQIGARIPAAAAQLALGDGTRELLLAETALLASRLGYDARAREILRLLTDADLDKVPNAQNLSLTYARLGDFGAARRQLDALTVRWKERFPPDALLPERQRFDRAEELFRGASRATFDPDRRVLRAEAFLELGAYLRALRELRPAFVATPNESRVGPLYVQLLVAAGLPQEALAVAVRALGDERGLALVQRISHGVPDRVRALRKPAEPMDWYGPLVGAK